jgi:D-glycero-alpha-D-manno-heptose-7-phosphate kinase
VSPYSDLYGGLALNATINRYATATVGPGGRRFTVRSIDYDATLVYGVDDPFVFDGQLDLAKGVLHWFRQTHSIPDGREVLIHNDAPPGSGLGSSSAVAVALVSAMAHSLQVEPQGAAAVARLAWQLERVDVGILGGRQDHYASAFGGLNFMEFRRDGTTIVDAVHLEPDILFELEYSTVLVYVGGIRFSAQILKQQMANAERGVDASVRAMHCLKSLTIEMRQALMGGEIRRFGALLDEAWVQKKQMANGISTPSIDALYADAKQAGALGGKISGAGGGGFMFFLCDARRRFHVQDAVRRHGAQIVPFSFVDAGVRVWTAQT